MKKPQIKIISTLQSRNTLCANALLFQLNNGRGEIYATPRSKDGYWEIFCGDRPLVYAHMTCPTCTGSLWTGYGSMMSREECVAVEDQINSGYKNLRDELRKITPLLGLFDDGIYVAAEYEFYPAVKGEHNADGCSEFFLNHERGAGVGLFGTYWRCLWCPCPVFLWPTQDPGKMNTERIDHYIERFQKEDEKTLPRSIAFAMQGTIALLLDGHHKAAAAAVLGKRVKSITLFRFYPGDEKTPRGDDCRKDEKNIFSVTGPLYFDINNQISDPAGNIIGSAGGMLIKEAPATAKKYEDEYEWGFLPEEYIPHGNAYPGRRDIVMAVNIAPGEVYSTFKNVYECRVTVENGEAQFDWYGMEKVVSFAKIFPETKLLRDWQKQWLMEFAKYNISAVESLLLKLIEQKKHPERLILSDFQHQLYRDLRDNRVTDKWFAAILQKYEECNVK